MKMSFIKELINSRVKEYKKKWYKKTPKQKWAVIYGVGDLMCKAIGVRAYSDMKINWYSVFSALVTGTYLVSAFYTLWFYYNEGDILRGIPCTCVSGIVITCFAVYVKTIGRDRVIVNNVISFGGKYIYNDDNEPTKYNEMCEKMIVELMKDLVVIVNAILFSYFTFAAGTVYALIFGNVRVTLLSTELPFLDKDSDIVYVVNMLVQSVIAVVGIIATVGIEIGAAMAYNTVAMMPELIHLESSVLRTELEQNGMSYSAKMRVRNVLRQLQDLDGYLREAFDMYYLRLFVGPYLFTYSISFSIFGQLVLGYPSGYGCAMCNFILLVYFCHLGENVKQTNQRLAYEMYEMPWYMLSPTYQRDVASAINMVQNRAVITIGPFAQLNLETASDLTKSIYKFTMMLIKLFK